MTNKIVCMTVVVTGIFCATTGSCDLIEPPIVDLSEGNVSNASLSAVMYINHLNHVVAKLGKMNDLYVLQQEYENLTDNNLNLASIKDEEVVRLIVELTDAVKGLQKANVKILRAQSRFEADKKAAIWEALPQPTMLIAAPHPAVIALAVAGAAMTSVQNYMSAKHRASEKLKDSLLESGNDMLEHINEINKELFLSQWRLMQRHGISDSLRITRGDSELFLGFCDILEAVGRDIRGQNILHAIFKSHEQEMTCLPFYWITRATAAKNMEELKDVEYCCRKFFALYETAPIVRRDMDACAMALSYVSVVLDKYKRRAIDKAWVRRWLAFIENTVRIPEWQTKFAIAMVYREIGDEEQAKRVLNNALLEVYACIRVWEYSGRTKNIFRTTPAMEKAYDKLSENDQNVKNELPNWDEEKERLVPYDGYLWLSGALFDLGDTGIYDRLSINGQKISLSKWYVSGHYRRLPPEFEKKGGDGYKLKHVPFGEKGSTGETHTVLKVSEYDNNGYLKECVCVNGLYRLRGSGDVLVYAQTEHGITVQYIFEKGRYNAPSRHKVVFPWSKADCVDAKRMER